MIHKEKPAQKAVNLLEDARKEVDLWSDCSNDMMSEVSEETMMPQPNLPSILDLANKYKVSPTPNDQSFNFRDDLIAKVTTSQKHEVRIDMTKLQSKVSGYKVCSVKKLVCKIGNKCLIVLLLLAVVGVGVWYFQKQLKPVAKQVSDGLVKSTGIEALALNFDSSSLSSLEVQIEELRTCSILSKAALGAGILGGSWYVYNKHNEHKAALLAKKSGNKLMTALGSLAAVAGLGTVAHRLKTGKFFWENESKKTPETDKAINGESTAKNSANTEELLVKEGKKDEADGKPAKSAGEEGIPKENPVADKVV